MASGATASSQVDPKEAIVPNVASELGRNYQPSINSALSPNQDASGAITSSRKEYLEQL
jgi:hypothetical protein